MKNQDSLQLNGWPNAGDNKLIPELKQKCKSISEKTGVAIGDDRQKRGLSELLDDLTRLKAGGLGIVLNQEKIKQGCQDAKANSKKSKGNDPIYASYKKVCTKGEKEQ